MTKGRFADEFKQEPVQLLVEQSYTVSDVAKRLGVFVQSLCKLVKAYASNTTDRCQARYPKKRPRTSRNTWSEVRLHLAVPGKLFGAA